MNRPTFAIIAALGISLANYGIAFDRDSNTLIAAPTFDHNQPGLISESCSPQNTISADQNKVNAMMCSMNNNNSSEFANALEVGSKLNLAANCLQVCVILSDGTQGRCFNVCRPFYAG